uniref:NUMOD1 domain-containing protein n=1 Tax=Uncinula necator TaxID=52586 RepID=A0A7U1BEY9_UNCNE|nr:NUMOD1 domain-containing protein [Erysiphe necator]QQY98191.1 NUMOD1 domain-containing protein [Erysiphe necator]
MREGGYKRMESYEVLAKLYAAQPSGIKVEVTNVETRTSTIYHAIKAWGRHLGIDKRYIEHYINFNQDKPVLGKYTFN